MVDQLRRQARRQALADQALAARAEFDAAVAASTAAWEALKAAKIQWSESFHVSEVRPGVTRMGAPARLLFRVRARQRTLGEALAHEENAKARLDAATQALQEADGAG